MMSPSFEVLLLAWSNSRYLPTVPGIFHWDIWDPRNGDFIQSRQEILRLTPSLTQLCNRPNLPLDRADGRRGRLPQSRHPTGGMQDDFWK